MTNEENDDVPVVADKVTVFDTTLRDGEQAPGFTMNVEQKLRMAAALRDLNVDVIEAGFAAASPGDEEAVHQVAREIDSGAPPLEAATHWIQEYMEGGHVAPPGPPR